MQSRKRFSLTRWSVLICLCILADRWIEAQEASPKSPQPAPARASTEKKLVYGLQPPPANYMPPICSIPEPDFDWGTVIQGEVVTHSYVIENPGGLPLRIERVRPSCGCTTTDYDREIPPKGKGQVTLKTNTRGIAGSTKKTAQIFTSASRDPKVVSMFGKVENPIEVDPKLPRVTKIRGVESEPIEVKLKRLTDKSLDVTGVKVAATGTAAKLVDAELKKGAATGEWTLVVTPKVPDDAGPYHYVEIGVQATVDGKSYDIPVRVSITVKNRIEAIPASLYFHNRLTAQLGQAGAAPVTREVEIKTLDPEHAFRITDVQVQGECFKAQIQTVEEGKAYKLVVALPKEPESKARRITEKIVVKTDDEMVPEITLNATANFAYGAATLAVPPPVRRTGPTATSPGVQGTPQAGAVPSQPPPGFNPLRKRAPAGTTSTSGASN